MSTRVPLDYEQPPCPRRWWAERAWRWCALVAVSSVFPVYVFVFERLRLRRDPWAYPFEWPERQPDLLVAVAVSAGIVRPVLGTAALIIASHRANARQRGLRPYCFAGMLSGCVLLFEIFTGFWDMD